MKPLFLFSHSVTRPVVMQFFFHNLSCELCFCISATVCHKYECFAGFSAISILEIVQSRVEDIWKAFHGFSWLLAWCRLLWLIGLCQAKVSANTSNLAGVLALHSFSGSNILNSPNTACQIVTHVGQRTSQDNWIVYGFVILRSCIMSMIWTQMYIYKITFYSMNNKLNV